MGLDAADELQDDAAEGRRDDLRQADGAVEEAEVAAHVGAAQGVGQ